jgi:hypothetical protein
MYVLRVIARADGMPDSNVGRFVRGFDPDYLQGRGLLVTTEHRHRAHRFDTNAAAFTFWQQESRVQPIRADGKPNRPLTAYTMSIEPHREG